MMSITMVKTIKEEEKEMEGKEEWEAAGITGIRGLCWQIKHSLEGIRRYLFGRESEQSELSGIS